MGRRSRTEEMIAALTDKAAAERFVRARDVLKSHLIHTREILNGRDFLFLGPEEDLRDALKLIVATEHMNPRFLHVDYVEIDKYFLLRVVGTGAEQEAVSSYFE
jgi:hypothetical protein